MDIFQKNLTQYTIVYLPGVSSDISNEFVLLFLGLFIVVELITVLYSFNQLRKSIPHGRLPEFTSLRLITLLSAPFFVSLIFLTHHLSGFPDIHRSGQLLGAIRVDPLFFKQIIIVWLIFLIIEAAGHIGYRRILRGTLIVMGSLSPFILNIMIMISHYAIKIPSVIY